MKAKGKEWFQHSDSFTASLDTAFRLWDAVSTTYFDAAETIRVLTFLFFLDRYTKHRRVSRGLGMLSYGMMRMAGWLRGGRLFGFSVQQRGGDSGESFWEEEEEEAIHAIIDT